MAQVFTGSGRQFLELQSVALDEENLEDITQRVKMQPHFLGEPLVVMASGENFSMPQREDLRELIALDVLGRAVTISMAIGTVSPERHIEDRAIELVSQASAYTPDELGKISREFLNIPSNDNLRRAWDEVGVEMNEEAVELASLLAVTFGRDAGDYADLINKEQRIIIAAEGFTTRMTNAINWLASAGVNIKGLRFQKYLVGGQEVYFAEQVVPRSSPAVDSRQSAQLAHETIEPWRAKGLAYYLDHLTPAMGSLLENIILQTREQTFSINWSHKYYFWLRGKQRTLRIRTYHRDRLEIGFQNASIDMVEDFINNFRLPGIEIYTVGGYADSPFISFSSGMDINNDWIGMLQSWLGEKQV